MIRRSLYHHRITYFKRHKTTFNKSTLIVLVVISSSLLYVGNRRNAGNSSRSYRTMFSGAAPKGWLVAFFVRVYGFRGRHALGFFFNCTPQIRVFLSSSRVSPDIKQHPLLSIVVHIERDEMCVPRANTVCNRVLCIVRRRFLLGTMLVQTHPPHTHVVFVVAVGTITIALEVYASMYIAVSCIAGASLVLDNGQQCATEGCVTVKKLIREQIRTLDAQLEW